MRLKPGNQKLGQKLLPGNPLPGNPSTSIDRKRTEKLSIDNGNARRLTLQFEQVRDELNQTNPLTLRDQLMPSISTNREVEQIASQESANGRGGPRQGPIIDRKSFQL